MDIEKYVKNNQMIIDVWKNRFDCLFYWKIKFIYDNEHWAQTRYDLQNQIAYIYPCDIDVEEDYLIHEILKLAFIICDHEQTKKLGLIKDLVAIVKKEY